jgi:hypothetical protein
MARWREVALTGTFIPTAASILSTDASDIHPLPSREPEASAPLGFLGRERMKDLLKTIEYVAALST